MEGSNTYLEIEEELIKRGFVSPDEMTAALEIRNAHLRQFQKPIGLILLDQKKVSLEQIKSLLSLSSVQSQIGKTAFEKELITRDQLTVCKTLSAKKKKTLSRVLVDQGYLSDTAAKKLMHAQLDSVDYIKQAIKYQMISEYDFEAASKLKAYRKSTCEILYEQNLVTLSELNQVFRKFSHDLKLGQILVQQMLVSGENLEKALVAQSARNQTLGKILLGKRLITLEQLYFALSIQYNTPFQKLDGYFYYDKQKSSLRNIVGQRYAFEKLIIPLFQNGNNLALGVSNPANIWNMHELQSMYPDLRMNCVLITDEKFEQLYAILYGEVLQKPIGRKSAAPEPMASDDKTVVISDPKNQQPLINNLYSSYQSMRLQTDQKLSEPDETEWFSEFIENSYRSICKKYDCIKVLYRCVTNDTRTEIHATPVP